VAKREEAPRARSNATLLAAIRAAHAASRGTYGAPRIHAELAAKGIRVGRKRVAQLMSQAGLAGASRRKFVVTTVRDGNRPAPDLVDRNFKADQPNRLWVADIPTWAGFLYLAVLLDAYSRQIVGWSFGPHSARHVDAISQTNHRIDGVPTWIRRSSNASDSALIWAPISFVKDHSWCHRDQGKRVGPQTYEIWLPAWFTLHCGDDEIGEGMVNGGARRRRADSVRRAWKTAYATKSSERQSIQVRRRPAPPSERLSRDAGMDSYRYFRAGYWRHLPYVFWGPQPNRN
jgi:hypothetical protein